MLKANEQRQSRKRKVSKPVASDKDVYEADTAQEVKGIELKRNKAKLKPGTQVGHRV